MTTTRQALWTTAYGNGWTVDSYGRFDQLTRDGATVTVLYTAAGAVDSADLTADRAIVAQVKSGSDRAARVRQLLTCAPDCADRCACIDAGLPGHTQCGTVNGTPNHHV